MRRPDLRATATLLVVAVFIAGTAARGLGSERVDITATDGVQLIGHLDGAAGAGVLLVPDIARDTRALAATADRIAARGFRVLRFDLRGHGDSDGPADPTAVERDAEGAFRYLIGRKIRPIYLVAEGASGPLAVELARRLPVEAVAIVESTPTDVGRSGPRIVTMKGALTDDAVLDAIVRLLQDGNGH